MIDTYQLTVADLMTVEPVVIQRDAPIDEAGRLMRDYRVHGLPVVDKGGRLVGVVSQTDLLWRATTRTGGSPHDAEGTRRVADVMSSPSITIPAAVPIHEAARVMADQRLHRLVVVDERDRPIGVISAMDFVHLIADAVTNRGTADKATSAL